MSRRRNSGRGESSSVLSNRRLPPAQERVLQALTGSDHQADLLGGRDPSWPVYQEDLWPSRRRPAPRGMGRSPIEALRLRYSGVSRAARPWSYGSRIRALKANLWPGQKATSIQVRAPARVRFCLQRGQRREVLFAVRVAGRRGLGRGGVRRTYKSQYRC